MSDNGCPVGLKTSELERIIATGATLSGTTNDHGAPFDADMRDAGEPKDKQERAMMCTSEEAMAVEDDKQRHGAEGRMLTDLPDACLSLIVSYLSPKDVARGACVCQGFRNTLDSDSVWDQLLPKSALEVAGSNDEFKAARTNKNMFMFLCKPFLLTKTLAYWLDRSTGGVCYSVAARGLRVVWGDDERYWGWSPRPGAMWPEVACLIQVCWFHTSGSIKCMLPPGAYTLSWRIQYETPTQGNDYAYGWSRLPTEFSVSTSDGSQKATSRRYLTNRPENAARQNELDELTPVRLVDDNWFEFDAGEVTVVDEEQVTSLEFSMVEIQGGLWKGGIALDGVVLRPSSLTRTTGRYLSVEELGERSLQDEGPPVGLNQVHPVGLLDRRGRLGGRGPIWGVLPIRRGGMRHVQADPPQSDAAED